MHSTHWPGLPPSIRDTRWANGAAVGAFPHILHEAPTNWEFEEARNLVGWQWNVCGL
jgi:hypothetical protein